ncbi:MAG: L-seryl-tRNA(Sec) selenium transferase [Acidobacteria bacterium]|nr:L-seryl-tRNA(Sec) selenium transferase [Acidobacteriota bacterium]
MANRRALPAVHRVLAADSLRDAMARWGVGQVRGAVRDALAGLRAEIAAGAPAPGIDGIADLALTRLRRHTAPAFPRVVNATGVVIHTNLGRAPGLAVENWGYLALEYDLDGGVRGERLRPVTERLTRYFGCEAATVVTNTAAALLLLLAAHASGREVVVSRGELIEIGGSFRLPDVMRAAGVRLVEVGCTNRTHHDDYAAAIGDATAGILVVHRSNFSLDGFVATPDLAELVALGHRHGVPVWVDQGSGCHLDLAQFHLRPEPTVRALLGAGADAVLFSGDKLFGGPQAGVLLGTERTIGPLQHHPLRRALRPDKSVLAGLAAVTDAYLAGHWGDVPLYRLVACPHEELRRRAERLRRALGRAGIRATVVATRAAIGGGTTPGQTLPSWAIAIPGGRRVAQALRRGTLPVVARVEQDEVMLDLRAVFPEEDRDLLAAIRAAVASSAGPSAAGTDGAD